jgi:hypothetical protein
MSTDASNKPSAAPVPVAARFGGLIGGASLLAVIYLLDKTGVFLAMKEQGPMSVEEIATAAECKTRLLKESLPAMAGAGFVDFKDGKYELNEEQAAALTDPPEGFWIPKDGEKKTTPSSQAGWGEMSWF